MMSWNLSMVSLLKIWDPKIVGRMLIYRFFEGICEVVATNGRDRDIGKSIVEHKEVRGKCGKCSTCQEHLLEGNAMCFPSG